MFSSSRLPKAGQRPDERTFVRFAFACNSSLRADARSATRSLDDGDAQASVASFSL